MASSYPGSLDSFTNPTSTDAMDASAALYHDVQHANINDAVEAVQAELGTDPAGAFPTVKAAISGHAGWLAYGGHSYGTAISGLRYANDNYPTTSISVVSQRLFVVRIVPGETFNCTKLFFCMHTLASTVTSAAVGIYDSSGNLLQEADVASAVTSVGIKSATITSQSLTAGSAYYVALLIVATTAGAFSANPIMSTAFGDAVGLDTSSPPAAYLSTQTSLPSTVTYSSMTRTASQTWVGVGA